MRQARAPRPLADAGIIPWWWWPISVTPQEYEAMCVEVQKRRQSKKLLASLFGTVAALNVGSLDVVS